MTLAGLFAADATTNGITVRAQPQFDADHSDAAAGRWRWTYHIRIENHRDDEVQLLDRHWIIHDGHGIRHDVEGAGVVGEQPRLSSGAAHDYVSGCELDTPFGSMRGSFGMIDSAGRLFDAGIPPFDLLSPAVRGAAS